MPSSPNSLLKKLGFSANDRVVILHADDIGMCHATLGAHAELDALGTISSAAVMVPCPWFLGTVEYARNHPQSDLGIHLTLNSEWSTYRWGPLSTRDRNSSLVDEQGYFYTKHEQPQSISQVEDVKQELVAQIQHALQAGMQPSHVDTHMLTLIHPRFLRIYLETAYQFGLPAMIARYSHEGWQQKGFSEPEAQELAAIVQEFEEQGYPMLDSYGGLKLLQATERMQQAQLALAALPAGIHHFYIHPSLNTPEAQAISPDWQARAADYETFCTPEMKAFLQKEGLQLIGYREVMACMPAGSAISE